MIKLFSKKFLYFPGCLASAVLPNIVDNYNKLFYRLQLDFFSLPENTCCGAVAFTNGYEKDFEDLKEKNLSLLKKRKIKSLVTNSGNCMYTFALHYDLPVQHVSQILVKYLHKFPVKYEEKVSIYDSPTLAVYEEPRKILDAIGFEVIDLEKNRKNTLLCGAEGGMIQNVPSLAENLSRPIFQMCKTEKLIVSDPLVFYHLKKNAPKNITVLELSEVLI